MYIYSGTLAIKKKEVLQFATPWTDLEATVVSEICQTEKDNTYDSMCGVL